MVYLFCESQISKGSIFLKFCPNNTKITEQEEQQDYIRYMKMVYLYQEFAIKNTDAEVENKTLYSYRNVTEDINLPILKKNKCVIQVSYYH